MGDSSEVKLMARWYFGGLASAGAACCTHPLDLIKVDTYFSRLAVSLKVPNGSLIPHPLFGTK